MEDEIKVAESIIDKECLYLLSAGEYSNYTVLGVYKGQIGVDLGCLLSEWRKNYLKEREEKKVCIDEEKELAKVIVSKTSLIRIDHEEIHISHEYVEGVRLPIIDDNK